MQKDNANAQSQPIPGAAQVNFNLNMNVNVTVNDSRSSGRTIAQERAALGPKIELAEAGISGQARGPAGTLEAE